MTAETPAFTQEPQATQRSRWRDWLQFAALALALLVVSEALWLWQTWPVRDLLQPTSPPQTGQPASGR
jgi:hypothetical protein